MKHLIILSALLVTFCSQAQITAIVYDSITKESIPYINIWVEGQDKGTSADENGNFTLEVIDDSNVLVFSAVGYKTKRIGLDSIGDVVELVSDVIQLSEVVINPKKYKEFVIGSLKKSNIKSYFEGVQNPMMPATYFDYKEEYADTPYLCKIRFVTSSSIPDTKFNIRLYSSDKEGAPHKVIFNKNIIGIAEKGKNITEIDVSGMNIRFPKEGLFIAFEFLIIPSNIDVITYTKSGSDDVYSYNRYLPLIGVKDHNERKRTGWIYEKGKWYRLTYSSLAIELVLMN